MEPGQYAAFCSLRDEFKDHVAGLSSRCPWLRPLQEALRAELGYLDYEIETPVVYNRDLDEVAESDEPLFLIVADNPGKNEQKAAQNRYLVGQSGKVASSWFASRLGLDFRKACVIINKTPIHTPKTAELSLMLKLAARESPKLAEEFRRALIESQGTMARLALGFHKALGCTLWVSGYGELRRGRLFRHWAEELGRLYEAEASSLRESVWVFRHFSMNQFSIEYSAWDSGSSTTAMHRLEAIGRARRKEILGW
ncbi:MAG TPA: hypothetical protein VIO60_05805 [Rectinemataceae bacterium]